MIAGGSANYTFLMLIVDWVRDVIEISYTLGYVCGYISREG